MKYNYIALSDHINKRFDIEYIESVTSSNVAIYITKWFNQWKIDHEYFDDVKKAYGTYKMNSWIFLIK